MQPTSSYSGSPLALWPEARNWAGVIPSAPPIFERNWKLNGSMTPPGCFLSPPRTNKQIV